MNHYSAAKHGRLNGSVDTQEFRAWCARCRRPGVTCYCPLIEPFDSVPRFVILSQPRETKHRLGTGRMAHLGLANSLWYEGVDFSHHPQVNQIIADPANAPLLLYPGPGSMNISRLNVLERRRLMDGRCNSVVFVVDGTWKSVRKMLRLSDNLRQLPKISFDPPAPSAYGFRREPRPECYSTIEAIHYLIELYNRDGIDKVAERRHDRLLKAFRFMVATQLAYSR
jgi:DTW domain-containing protein YfiP